MSRLSMFFLVVAAAFAIWILLDAIRSHRQARHEKAAACVLGAKKQIDQAAYQAEVDLRRCYTERTGRMVPPPNPFKYS